MWGEIIGRNYREELGGAGAVWVVSDRGPPAPGPGGKWRAGWTTGGRRGGYSEGCPGVSEDEEEDSDNCIDMSPVRDSCTSSMMRITFFDIDDDRLESPCLVFIVTHPHTPSDKCSGPSGLSTPMSHLQAGIPKLPSPHTPINGRIKPKLAIRIILPLQPPQPLLPPFLISIQLLRLLMPKPVIHIPPRRLLGPVRPGHDTLDLHGRRNDVVAP